MFIPYSIPLTHVYGIFYKTYTGNYVLGSANKNSTWIKIFVRAVIHGLFVFFSNLIDLTDENPH